MIEQESEKQLSFILSDLDRFIAKDHFLRAVKENVCTTW